MRTTLSARLLSTAAVAVLLAGGLAACGGTKDLTLSKADAKSALLTQKNVGDGFKPDDSSDDDSKAPGCLGDLQAKTKAPVDEEADYVAANDSGLPAVGSEVASYKSVSAAQKAMAGARDAISKCTSVSADEDGAHTELAITNSNDKLASTADEELNISAKGTVSASGQQVPFALAFAAARIGSDVVVISAGDISADASANLAAYLKTAVDRLKAVRDGKTPDDTLVETAARLSDDQAKAALLTQTNLGSGFVPDTESTGSTSPGCLSAVDDITTSSQAPEHQVARYMTNTKDAFPLVASFVDSYDSVADATAALEKFKTAIAACTSVDDADSDGTTYKLTVQSDPTKTDATSSDQVNVIATGTFSSSGGGYPLWLGLAAVRIDNNISITTVGDLANKAPGDVSKLIKVADARLAAVMSGETPS